MLTDWRRLFDAIRVEWRDRGRNSSRSNVNICCPWCGRSDSGFHMAVSEERDAYYCFRRPNEHMGSNVVHLLTELGLSRADAVSLINEHTLDQNPQAKLETKKTSDFDRWQFFLPSTKSAVQLEYLESREFTRPFETANRYDLRYAEAGKWSHRLLIPLTGNGETMHGWTGRAILKRMEPRYLSFGGNDHGAIYLPRPARTYMVIVEGPLDALKLAVATEQHAIGVIGLLGKQMNAARLLRIREALENCREVRVVLDADTQGNETLHTITELRNAVLRTDRKLYINRISLPSGTKDVGEMTEKGVVEWLRAETPWSLA